MKIVPDLNIDEIQGQEFDAVIIPGGMSAYIIDVYLHHPK